MISMVITGILNLHPDFDALTVAKAVETGNDLIKFVFDPNSFVCAVLHPLPDKTRIKRQIDNTDKQIDNLVYQLYGLTDEEIAIVEQNQ